jgi:hypothetical protein
VFYHALVLAALYSELTEEEREEANATLDIALVRLQLWGENSPRNFGTSI